jgi:hypothetical protein
VDPAVARMRLPVRAISFETIERLEAHECPVRPVVGSDESDLERLVAASERWTTTVGS